MFETASVVTSARIGQAMAIGYGLLVPAMLWLLAVETRWFAHRLRCGAGRALGQAALGIVQWLGITLLLMIPFGV